MSLAAAPEIANAQTKTAITFTVRAGLLVSAGSSVIGVATSR